MYCVGILLETNKACGYVRHVTYLGEAKLSLGDCFKLSQQQFEVFNIKYLVIFQDTIETRKYIVHVECFVYTKLVLVYDLFILK